MNDRLKHASSITQESCDQRTSKYSFSFTDPQFGWYFMISKRRDSSNVMQIINQAMNNSDYVTSYIAIPFQIALNSETRVYYQS